MLLLFVTSDCSGINEWSSVMTDANLDPSPSAAVDRLVRATNAHDLDGIVDCFCSGYVNETPAHPARSFAGREQVRTNWRHILAAVPDLRARVLRSAVSLDVVWSEWEMSGTQLSGATHLMRGVIIFGILDGRVNRARFYLEPVDADTAGIDAAVDAHVGAPR